MKISIDDARRFRRLTVGLVAGAAVLASTLILMDVAFAGSPVMQFVAGSAGLATGFAIVLFIFLLLATDMPTFIWRGLPNDPIYLSPLHHYACAPLALMAAAIILGAVASVLTRHIPGLGLLGVLLFVPTGVLGVTSVYQVWFVPLVFMRIGTGCSRRRELALALYLPLHWFLMALASAGVVIILMAAMEEVFRLLY